MNAVEDWENGQLPEEITFDYERDWIAGVVVGHAQLAETAAAAARMMLDHQGYNQDDPDPRLRTLYRRLEDAAFAAEQASLAAQAAYANLENAADHGEIGQTVAELASRNFDATLHLATMIGLMPRTPADPRSADAQVQRD